MDTPNQTPVQTPVAQPLPMQTEEPGASRTRMWMIVGAVVVVLGLVATMFGGGMFKGSFLDAKEKLPLYVEIGALNLNGDKSNTMNISIIHTGKDDIPNERKFTLHVYGVAKDASKKLLFSKPWNAGGTTTFRAHETLAYNIRIPASEFEFSKFKTLHSELVEVDAQGKETMIVEHNFDL